MLIGFKKIHQSRRVIAVLGCFFLLSACSNSDSFNPEAKGVAPGQFTQLGGAKADVTGKSGGGTTVDQIFASGASGPAASEDYKIAALDVVEVTVLGVPDLSRTYQVASSGTITMPLIKTVQASGKNTSELEREISRKLGATYLQSPQVSVFVKEFKSQRITISGEVNKPGIYPITGKTTLLQAISLGEGLTLVADTSAALVFRTVDGKRMGARFDLKKIQGGKINDPTLLAGDIVVVDTSASRSTLRDAKDFVSLTNLFSILR
jgi:polysaccharide biosynthesis/export protein